MTNPKIFLQASVPRSGSTLLQNIIGQNPNFYVTPTSGLSSFLQNQLHSFSQIPHFKKYKDYNKVKDAFYNYCKQGIIAFYKTFTSKPYILDKSKVWLQDYPFVSKIINQPKIIILVRDLRDVLLSYEKMYIKDPTQKYRWNIDTDIENLPIEDRFNAYITSTPLEQYLIWLYNIINSNLYSNLHIIKFEQFILEPENEIRKIYDYLEVPYFKHNFNKIEQITEENDNFHVFGDHIINSKLDLPLEKHSNIIPNHISDQIYKDFEWYFTTFNYQR